MLKTLVLPIGLTTFSALNVGQAQFVMAPESPFVTNAGDLANGVATGDVNEDGAADFVITNGDPPGFLRSFLGQGDGTFTAAPGSPYSTGDVPNMPDFSDLRGMKSVVLGDVNDDGHLDALVTKWSSALPFDLSAPLTAGELVVFFGDGSGDFAPLPSIPTGGYGPDALRLADLDGDGIDDVLIANRASAEDDPQGRVTWLRGLGGGSYAAAELITLLAGPPLMNFDVLAEDVDGDGMRDVVILDGVGAIRVLVRDGTSFSEVMGSPFATPLTEGGLLTSADFDGNGTLDLAAVSYRGATIALLLGDGAAGFTASPQLPVSPDATSFGGIGAADVNGDSTPDLILVQGGTNTAVAVLINDGSASFSPLTDSPYVALLDSLGNLGITDFDGDARLDLVTLNSEYASRVVVMLNVTPQVDPEPPPPHPGHGTLLDWLRKLLALLHGHRPGPGH